MEIGNLRQKASNKLVWFVFSCAFISSGLLYIMQKSEAVAENLYDSSTYSTNN